MADWNWDLVRAQCLREARGVLGDPATSKTRLKKPRFGPGGAGTRARRRSARRPGSRASRATRRSGSCGQFARNCSEENDFPAEASHEDEVLGKTDLARAIDGLSGLDRELVHGRFWDDLDYRQLSLRLDISEGAARVRLHRALGRLREALVET